LLNFLKKIGYKSCDIKISRLYAFLLIFLLIAENILSFIIIDIKYTINIYVLYTYIIRKK